MESTQQSDRETYRAIVLSKDGGGLLMAASENGLLLPSVEIPRWRRHAECLTAGMMSEWGCEVICLFAPDGVGTATDINIKSLNAGGRKRHIPVGPSGEPCHR